MFVIGRLYRIGWIVRETQRLSGQGGDLSSAVINRDDRQDVMRLRVLHQGPDRQRGMTEWYIQNGFGLVGQHHPQRCVDSTYCLQAKRIGHELKPLEIVVVNTAAGEAYGKDSYVDTGCGMGREATLYLLERGVRVTGTDGWSWDALFSHTREKYAETGDASLIWEGHRAGMEIGYCHLEKLHNLEALPADGFTIACFPFKIRAASAGFTRAVAIFDE